MAKNSDHLRWQLDAEDTGGLLSGFLAEEDEFDRRALWRLGSWGVGAVGSRRRRRDGQPVPARLAARPGRRRRSGAAGPADPGGRQESQNQARQLASAIDTLNSDRDRLYSRVTTLEQGLDSVTGAIARQTTPPVAPPAQATPAEAPSAQSAPRLPRSAPSRRPCRSRQHRQARRSRRACRRREADHNREARCDREAAASRKTACCRFYPNRTRRARRPPIRKSRRRPPLRWPLR